MSLAQLIKNRRTVYQFEDKPISLNLIESFIEAAVHAPNHKLTEPWQFLIIGRQTQDRLAKIYASNRASKNHEEGSEGYRLSFENSIKKFLAIPQLVLVVQNLSKDPVICKEDYAACSCAIQNFQLSAWEQGIGVQWSSGPILKDAETFSILELDSENHELIAALYMGYPLAVGESQRKAISEVIRHYD
ncbi:nitroreductase family protein [Hydrogenovibrio marinus]|uniref:Nitroreductase n=1 Tax=Hydrogenovibrio marinus TaxID=28885 RepID=A0A066ZQF7_HYDMR|nr:nitroreductase [Hydrogenovibrio marinus]KDN96048.1 nitroreductase [Hydrogenovibrio marinus]BBN58456.1 NAD(P)H nitroreductase [Hydrogenovibrio marinus]